MKFLLNNVDEMNLEINGFTRQRLEWMNEYNVDISTKSSQSCKIWGIDTFFLDETTVSRAWRYPFICQINDANDLGLKLLIPLGGQMLSPEHMVVVPLSPHGHRVCSIAAKQMAHADYQADEQISCVHPLLYSLVSWLTGWLTGQGQHTLVLLLYQ